LGGWDEAYEGDKGIQTVITNSVHAMKDAFPGFYSPSDTEYNRLWKEATIVLDTNVLLNLYRLPTTARNELFAILEILKDRLWIPHQVALEFQRNRLAVISSERKFTEDALASASALVGGISTKVEALQMDKRGLEITAQPLLENLDQANRKLVEAIQKVHQAQLDIAARDPVRERLDKIFEGRVGCGPDNQAALDALCAGGEERYAARIPPGFADSEKDKNPSEATYVHGHLKYQRKFGDLVLWRQLIDKARELQAKSILLITSEKKDDWWWREQGKTIGPHPELIQEIRREAGVSLFWMYSPVQFMELAPKYTTATVSNTSVAELQQVVQLPTAASISTPIQHYSAHEAYFDAVDLAAVQDKVGQWLQLNYSGDLSANTRGFPDFIVQAEDSAHGFEVRYLRNFDRMLFSPMFVNALLRGYLETREGRIQSFTMVGVISEESYLEISRSEQLAELQRRVARLLTKYPITAIVIGAIVGGKVFEPLIMQMQDMGFPGTE
jgi:hypothetical protein